VQSISVPSTSHRQRVESFDVPPRQSPCCTHNSKTIHRIRKPAATTAHVAFFRSEREAPLHRRNLHRNPYLHCSIKLVVSPVQRNPDFIRTLNPAHNNQRRTVMPLLIPILWVGGGALLLGGGYYIVHTAHFFH
jgi:hypothetical protein